MRLPLRLLNPLAVLGCIVDRLVPAHDPYVGCRSNDEIDAGL